MSFDFDTQLSLRGTHCSKHDNMVKYFKLDADDAIPMWVADMEYPAAPAVLAAMQSELDRGYMGYFADEGPIAEAITNWMERKHGFAANPEHVRFTHGVIQGLAISIHALTEPGDSVIVFPPVYHVFFNKTRALGRDVLESPLVERDGQFHMDLEALQASLTGREKMVLFCSPQNPGGRLWTSEEIRELAAFCKKNDLWLISDEIHMDLTFPGHDHIPTLVAAPEATERTIILSAASKGFNLAGGETAFAIIPDDDLRAKFSKALAYIGGTPNRFGMLMIKAAFNESEDWSAAARAYIAENFAIWKDRIGALPGVSVMDMNATYLSWVDFTATGLSDEEITDRIIGGARIAPSPGTQFGSGGAAHRRFNIALPRTTLMTAIERIEAAFADLQ